MISPSLAAARRVVVKIGSALVVDAETAAPREGWIASVAADVAALRARGTEVVLVSSGAIALARRALGLTRKKLRLEEKQAAAAVGQIRLAGAWQAALAQHGLTAAQLLLTLQDSEDRRRYLNARATLGTLLDLGCVPVINENDTVATAEIRFGDNDRLAARVAEMLHADALVLLSDIDGLYTADPRNDPEARHLPIVERITDEIMAMGGEPPPGYSSGGMRTKLIAARIATGAGCAMAIALGKREHPLQALMKGARCSWFLPAPKAAPPGSSGSPAAWRRSACCGWMPVRRRPCAMAVPCCRPACARWRAASRAETRSRCRTRPAPSWRAAFRPMMPSQRGRSPGAARRRSRPSSAGAGGTRSSTGTTWSCSEPGRPGGGNGSPRPGSAALSPSAATRPAAGSACGTRR